MEKGLILLIQAYRYLLSPWIGNSCRFYPSCSRYAEEALARFGLIKGIKLTFCRLLRCHPGCEGGIDELPQNGEAATLDGPKGGYRSRSSTDSKRHKA